MFSFLKLECVDKKLHQIHKETKTSLMACPGNDQAVTYEELAELEKEFEDAEVEISKFSQMK